MADLGLSLVLSFDGSVLYGPANATPATAAIGYVISAHEPIVEGSRSLSTFVSSTHVEYRALVAGARAVTNVSDHRTVASLHVRGDAVAPVEAVDPDHPTEPNDGILRRRVETVQTMVDPIPQVSYRTVPRARNRRAHELARRPHRQLE
ncbi:reverse transcriptase-like protein [Haloplanus sp.]|uniref:reverse transcriptase-like protein n=1 Tax=Haloplanus sp. TaxID=1961696 RepID=UPI00260BAE04|nr:reverse transcriptase-like protein [Haloplanus sp.]